MSASVFPARAGMSPAVELPAVGFSRVPRASGDEPLELRISGVDEVCSPRERG